MNFSSMEYFIVLAQERNFTRAAERLHITQQSLSSHIAGMENELGCQLVVRHVPLKLTYAGEVMLQYAESFHKKLNEMQREFSDITQNQKGLLHIGAASSRGRVLLPGAITLFHKHYPHIRIDLTEASNGVLHQALLKGTLDLAIADFPEVMPGIKLCDYYQEEIVLLVSRMLFADVYGDQQEYHQQQLKKGQFDSLRYCPIVIGGEDDIDGQIGYHILKKAGIGAPYIRASSHNVGMLLDLCLQGAGACFCPKNIARSILSPSQTRKLLTFPLGKEARYSIRFGYQLHSYQWSVIEYFMKCAKDSNTQDHAPKTRVQDV